MLASARAARRTIATRTATAHAKARIHRNHGGSLITHAIEAGLPIREARSVAGSLRTSAKRLGVTGRTVQVRRHGHTRDFAIYTPAEVALIATNYRPRKPAYKTARQHLLLAA
ncbi:hypothetical protein [Streptacidiphilus rugosus]|uniref:hypothetical protein n=1 Tax=Streptacidiphilus rugosus TaxID=405783 RepID=UPI00056429E0|nr:hypothetical protein [Streptacidiphilus rugosus]